jgi:FkbM family methyltransferase
MLIEDASSRADESIKDVFWAASQLLRFVPSGLGAHAAARQVLARNKPASPTLRRQKLAGGARVELDLADRGEAQAYLLRRYEPDVVALLTRLARRGGTFFDVGANIGLITFSVGARRPDLSIHAFEPDPTNASRWRRNLAINPRVTARLEEVAVGEAMHNAVLNRGNESGWSFIADSGPEFGVEVQVISLDAYAAAWNIDQIDILKVDVEGYEARVLEGAASLLTTRKIAFIVCELDEMLLRRSGATRNAVVALLARYGYVPGPVPGVGAQWLRRRAWETSHDVLFASRPLATRATERVRAG